MKEKIEALLDERVRPLFSNHGGGVEIVSLEEYVLKIKMTGKCSNCPSASADTEEVVAKEVKEAFPQIKDVILVNHVSEELVDMALSILRRDK